MSKRRQKAAGIMIAGMMVISVSAGLGGLSVVRVPEKSDADAIMAALLTPRAQISFTPESTSFTPGAVTPSPRPEVLGPPGTMPLGSVELGVQMSDQGRPTGTMLGKVECRDAGMMQIQTFSGRILVGINQQDGGSCQAVVSQWQSLSPKEGLLGVRYFPDQNSLSLFDPDGKFITANVTGAWTAQ